MDFKKKIAKELSKHLNVSLNTIESTLEIPPDSKLGDFAFPCFILSKELKKSPQQIATDISTNLKLDNIEVKATGPYVNFFIDSTQIVKNTVSEILTQKDEYGSVKDNNETILIDYSAPNVAKNMGIHNLRSTIIGQALYNIYKKRGYTVVGINHLGDWGTQFGKLIWALEKWSSIEELKEKGIIFLNDMYVKFHAEAEKEGNEFMEDEARAWFKKIEDNDEKAKQWWKLFVDISLESYNKIYSRLNISFDETKGESFYIPLLDNTIKELEDKKLTSISEGALVIDFKDAQGSKATGAQKTTFSREKMPPLLLKKTDGATLYGTRDMAAALYRLKKYQPKKILYAVDIAQTLHFQQLFRALELIDEKNKDIFEHISFGRLSFPDGSMSTRKGNIVPLQEVLDKAKEKVLKIISEKNPELKNKENVAEMVGTGAIIFGDLCHDRIHNITFEWDKVLDFQGESAPYIQYSVARINSIIRKESYDKDSINYDLISEDIEKQLVKKLQSYPKVLDDSIKSNKPHILAKLILEVAQDFNNYYAKNKIIDDNTEVKNARLALIDSIRIVLKDGLKLLGINSPEEM